MSPNVSGDPTGCVTTPRVGLLGAGQMARALARGWRRPVLCTDTGSGRAADLVAEVGGEVVANNVELAERADVTVLCHKPAQLLSVAREIDGVANVVVSVLSGVTVAALRGAYRRSPVARVTVNLPVEVRAGVLAFPPSQGIRPDLDGMIAELFGQLGTLVRIPERQIPAVIALAGIGPALLAVFAEAQVDAAVHGALPSDMAAMLASETMRGTGALLAARGYDTLALRRAVSSPGGVTARSLVALEAGGLRSNVIEACLRAQQTCASDRGPPDRAARGASA